MTKLKPAGEEFSLPPEPWLQPVRLPIGAWLDFNRQIRSGLAELEREHQSQPLFSTSRNQAPKPQQPR